MPAGCDDALLDERAELFGALERRAAERERNLAPEVPPARQAADGAHFLLAPDECRLRAADLSSLQPAVAPASTASSSRLPPPVLDAERAGEHLGVVAVEGHDVGGEGHRRRLADLEEARGELELIEVDDLALAGGAGALEAAQPA